MQLHRTQHGALRGGLPRRQQAPVPPAQPSRAALFVVKASQSAVADKESTATGPSRQRRPAKAKNVAPGPEGPAAAAPEAPAAAAAAKAEQLLQELLGDTPLKPTNTLGPRRRMPEWFSLARGQVVKGEVQAYSYSGEVAIVRLSPSLTGLLHISLFGEEHVSVEEFQAALTVGTEVEAMVQKVEQPGFPGAIPRVYLTTRLTLPRSAVPLSAAALLKEQERQQHGAPGSNRRSARRRTAAAEEAGLPLAEQVQRGCALEVEESLQELEQKLAEAGEAYQEVHMPVQDGALLRCTVAKHMAFGAVVAVDTEHHPQAASHQATLLLHISQVTGQRITQKQLAELLPLGTQVVVQVAKDKSGRHPLSATLKCWERGSGEWMVDRDACLRRAEEAWQEQQERGQQGEDGGDKAGGDATQQQLRVSAAGTGALAGVMRSVDRLPLSVVAAARSPELLARYAELVSKVEEATARALGPLPWNVAAELVLEGATGGDTKECFQAMSRRHQFLVVQQLGLNLKARAARLVAQDLSWTDGAAEEAQRRDRVLTEQEGVAVEAVLSSAPAPPLVAELAGGLREAVAALHAAQHPDVKRMARAVVAEWMRPAGPALLAWAQRRTTSRALLASGVVPVLQEAGFLWLLHSERPEAWRQVLDDLFTKLARGLEREAPEEDAGGEESDAEEPRSMSAAQHAAVLRATGLLQLALALSYSPTSSAWLILLRTLRDRVPQLWTGVVPSDLRAKRNLQYLASRLAGRVLDAPAPAATAQP